MVIVDLAANETLRQICNQKDVNADMAVINPNRLIEEWIDDDVDVILYDRIMNSEVAAGSYLVRFQILSMALIMELYRLEN
uniref:RCK N-terminal domain-containing protein n=1 Tax=Parascaris univalens TaxID=6257 RepID=A0A915CDE2_PARUN